MLLHFGELHLIFNLLWLWYFGRQLESIIPWWSFALLVAATAFVGEYSSVLAVGLQQFRGHVRGDLRSGRLRLDPLQLPA